MLLCKEADIRKHCIVLWTRWPAEETRPAQLPQQAGIESSGQRGRLNELQETSDSEKVTSRIELKALTVTPNT